jgi:hypothetical protein
MTGRVLLIQLPIPQLNFGKQTGNIPLAGAYLKQAAAGLTHVQVDILPESLSGYLGDAAILDLIFSQKPEVLGFTVFSWNVERSLYIARKVKEKIDVRVVFGGPESTPDNLLTADPVVDFRVFGEGEALFVELLKHPELWAGGSGSLTAEHLFQTAPSPYLAGFLEPWIENMVLIETQRGCPYRCGYCYYNKSHTRVQTLPQDRVLDGVRWACDQGLSEVFLLDPSLNARKDLNHLLKAIAEINSDRRLAFLSETRAEFIGPELAQNFARAGFREFEIGLQSANPKALGLMNRPTDLDRFARGLRHLKQAGVQADIDLIVGLPGDDLNHFKASVDYVADLGLHDDIQVFPLALLPGTDFRYRARELGLKHQSHPPYLVIETPDFSADEMTEAFFYAEDVFEVSLQPEPGLDLSYQWETSSPEIPPPGFLAEHNGKPFIYKIILEKDLPIAHLTDMARRVTHPYQIVFMPGMKNQKGMLKTVKILSGENPYTPFEMVFMEPSGIPDIDAFEEAIQLRRPLYLDLDLPALGSRSVLYTLVSSDPEHRFNGLMKRQVFWWRSERPPTLEELETFLYLEGVLMDNGFSREAWAVWQDETAPHADDLPALAFADPLLHRRWLRLTGLSEYWDQLIK